MANGYDGKTGLYLASDVTLPAMPDNPTRDQALFALTKLKALLDEVAFVDDGGASRSVALSAMLTAVVRGMLNAAPAHGATASTRGTGKSYMFDTVSAIVLGTYCPVIAASSDPPVPELPAPEPPPPPPPPAPCAKAGRAKPTARARALAMSSRFMSSISISVLIYAFRKRRHPLP
jgi:hypothetical protein